MGRGQRPCREQRGREEVGDDTPSAGPGIANTCDIFPAGSTSPQNEEVLKKCAQEYLSRVKKEEQRYQALKVHAEEKLDR